MTPTKQLATRRRLVLAACMMATFTVAIESTIVATSMPSIVAQLGGFKLYSWVFAVYLLTQAVSMPVYGKLSDLFGRKHLLSFGLALFALSSLACGFATSLEMLIAFRFMQGLGAGAINPLVMTILADLYSVRERGALQGYMSMVWGLSAILGPLAGAVLVQYVHWAWVFWASLPFVALALLLLNVYLHEAVQHHKVRIDYAGAALVFVALSALILALTLGAEHGLLVFAGLLALSAAAFAVLILHEARTPEPIIALKLWTRRLVVWANLSQGVGGMVLIGVISLLPIYVQGVLGGSAVVAGIVLCVASIGWSISSTISGRHMFRTGVRGPARVGGVLLAAGSAVIAFGASHGALVAGFGSLLVGLGMGLLNTSLLYAIQASVDKSERGAATASNILMRTLGNAVGASLFGGILNFTLQRHLERHGATDQLTLDSVRMLLGGGPGPAQLSAEANAALHQGLAGSVQSAFLALMLCGILAIIATWRVPAVNLSEAASAERA